MPTPESGTRSSNPRIKAEIVLGNLPIDSQALFIHSLQGVVDQRWIETGAACSPNGLRELRWQKFAARFILGIRYHPRELSVPPHYPITEMRRQWKLWRLRLLVLLAV